MSARPLYPGRASVREREPSPLVGEGCEALARSQTEPRRSWVRGKRRRQKFASVKFCARHHPITLPLCGPLLLPRGEREVRRTLANSLSGRLGRAGKEG